MGYKTAKLDTTYCIYMLRKAIDLLNNGNSKDARVQISKATINIDAFHVECPEDCCHLGPGDSPMCKLNWY